MYAENTTGVQKLLNKVRLLLGLEKCQALSQYQQMLQHQLCSPSCRDSPRQDSQTKHQERSHRTFLHLLTPVLLTMRQATHKEKAAVKQSLK